MLCMWIAASRTYCTVGSSNPIKIATMVIATITSISEIPFLRVLLTSYPGKEKRRERVYAISR